MILAALSSGAVFAADAETNERNIQNLAKATLDGFKQAEQERNELTTVVEELGQWAEEKFEEAEENRRATDRNLTLAIGTKVSKAQYNAEMEEFSKWASDEFEASRATLNETVDAVNKNEENIKLLAATTYAGFQLAGKERQDLAKAALETAKEIDKLNNEKADRAEVEALGQWAEDEFEASRATLNETVEEVNKKADKAAVDAKADKAVVDTLSVKVESKADKSAVDAKADKAVVDTLSVKVESKADKSAVDAKADKAVVDTLSVKVESKADKAAVDAKADKATVDALDVRVVKNTTEIANLDVKKADKAELAVLNTNVSSLTNTVGKLGTRIDANTARLNSLEGRVTKVQKEVRRGLASQAALAGLFQPYNVGKVNVTAAVGGYKSNTAVAIGAGYRFNEKFAAKAGVAINGSSTSYNVGVNYEF